MGEICLVKKVGKGGQKVFIDKKDYFRFVLSLEFYNSQNPVSLWSLFLYKSRNKKMFKEEDIAKHSLGGSSKEKRFKRNLSKRIWQQREIHRKGKGGRVVSILGFVLLPKGFYLLVKEVERGGLSRFMQKLGGYTYYFNKRHKRKGVLFCHSYECQKIRSKEKALLILHHLHLKPFSRWFKKRENHYIGDNRACKKKLLRKISSYRYSSFCDYIGKRNFPSVTNRGIFLDYLRGTKSYRTSVFDCIKTKMLD